MTVIEPMQRRAELAENLARVESRIVDAARAAGRQPSEVTLIAVTKYFPASDVQHLSALGVSDVGENKHQEAAAKAAACADLQVPVRWHYIGGLQSNKAAAVAAYADVVQSVDRPKLLAPLARGASDRGRVLDVMVQVSLDGAGAAELRAGASPADALRLADDIAAVEHLNLVGVMAVAPLQGDPRSAFERLAQVAEKIRAAHPQARAISAGMSGDLEEAIEFGATHVRVGSAILGNRPFIK